MVGESFAFAPMLAISSLPITYSVYPNLPEGLTLDSNSGVIQGSPSKQVATSTYTVAAFDGDMTELASFSLSIGKSLKSVDLIDIKYLAQSRIALQYRRR